MKPLTLRLSLSVTPRSLRAGLACALVGLTATDLASESVTLTTYYPAPQGVYSNMITTGDTRLGRNGGVVEIGTTATVGTRLTVMNGYVGIGTLAPANELVVSGNSRLGSSTAGAVMVKTGSATEGRIRPAMAGGSLLISDDSELATRGITITSQGKVGVLTASPHASAALHVVGQLRATPPVASACSTMFFPLGSTVYCPVNSYVTWSRGIMTRLQTMPESTGGDMYCCPCPAGGCPNLD